ncbi:MAG: CDC27 family protein, partial [Pseudomonadota bacterium]
MDSFKQSGELTGSEDSKVWDVLARSDPASPALLFLARSYLALGKPERALETAQTVLSVHPDLIEASLLVARALVRLNRYEEAREVLGRAWSDLSTLAESLETLGSLLAFVGLPSEAARAQWAALALRAEGEPSEKQPV